MDTKYRVVGKGFLMPTDKTSGTGPITSGKIEIGDVEYRVAGWDRISRSGKDYLSLSISVVDDTAADDAPPAKKSAPVRTRPGPRRARGG